MAWLCEDCLKQMSPCINSLSRGKGSLDCSRLSFPFSPDATTRRLSLSEFFTIHASYLLIFHVAALCSVLHGRFPLITQPDKTLNLSPIYACLLDDWHLKSSSSMRSSVLKSWELFSFVVCNINNLHLHG